VAYETGIFPGDYLSPFSNTVVYLFSSVWTAYRDSGLSWPILSFPLERLYRCFYYYTLLPTRRSIPIPVYPVYLAHCGTYPKYSMNCLSRDDSEGTFWRGTNKRKQTVVPGRRCQSPSPTHRSDHDQNMSSGPKGSRPSLKGPSLTLHGNRSSSRQNEQRSLSVSAAALRFSSRDDSWFLFPRADQPGCRGEVLPLKYPSVAAARTVCHVNLEGTQRGLGVLRAAAKGNRQKTITSQCS
jgi:hypothetical protein